MENLGRFRLFVRVARAGSFVEAARRLAVTPSGVGKAIARLEHDLGATLFHRNSRSISLTAEGRMLLGRCERILQEIDELEAELGQFNERQTGQIKIAVPRVGSLLVPVLVSFQRQHPNIEIEINEDDRIVNVVEEGFDLAVRTGQPADSRLVMKRLRSYGHLVVASPAYLSEHGQPGDLSDLKQHRCIRHRLTFTGKIASWENASECGPAERLPASIITNNIESMLQLVLAGHGIARLPSFAVKKYIGAGQLISIFERDHRGSVTFSALWPRTRSATGTIRALVQHVAKNMAPSDGADS
ncbi:LysR family transcriptional regulator [Gluconacetobacter azotocaptans]|uniref:LysR family transcriptional regulator n=1 Tax=Gluconacetobacter azotocaptans TaxID=142834 RepID=UPI001959D965|nr:LysR family transcriptional regulator [Gluconacetobacter azotocaptans]MBM9400794.1 LysR family transcriptional regulator [Gluconacetobacter azotocaptans]